MAENLFSYEDINSMPPTPPPSFDWCNEDNAAELFHQMIETFRKLFEAFPELVPLIFNPNAMART